MGLKGYKVFEPNWTSKGISYIIGDMYTANEKTMIYEFCALGRDCFSYMRFNKFNKVAEVEAFGEVRIDDGICYTSAIKILKEVTWQELLEEEKPKSMSITEDAKITVRQHPPIPAVPTHGEYCIGKDNLGEKNIGDRNILNSNIGCDTIGYFNKGDRVIGDNNISRDTIGNNNNGRYIIGECNKGRNIIGSWNKARQVIGCFNTENQPVYLFNKPTNLSLREIKLLRGIKVLSLNFKATRWVPYLHMTKREEKDYPEHKITKGYLKLLNPKTAYQDTWNKLTDDDKQAVMSIPNFDADIFEEITGIRV